MAAGRSWRGMPKLRRSGASAVGLTLATSLLVGLLILLIPQPPPYLSIDLVTETLRYRVAREQLSAVPLIAARVTVPDCAAADAGPVTALLMPAQDVMVQYRWSPQSIGISLTGAREGSVGTLHFRDESRCDLPERQATIQMPTPANAALAHPLPVAGPAEAGVEMRVPTAPEPGRTRVFTLLREGTIKVFARTALPPAAGALYPLNDAQFPVPAGTRLASGPDIAGGGDGRGASWYGVATIGAEGLNVSVTTETRALVLYRPGFGAQQESFAVGVFARLFNDPSLGYLTLGIAIVTFFAQMVTGWMSVWRDGAEAAGAAAPTDARRLDASGETPAAEASVPAEDKQEPPAT